MQTTLNDTATPTAITIIFDKIIPPREQPRISRLRLLKMLHVSLASCTSTIITGRAGTGKTLLASDFAQKCGRPVAWYKVESSDSELSMFYQYLVASVRTQRPHFGEEALARLFECTAPEDLPLLAEAFAYDLQESGSNPLLIVIDDLHLIYDLEWMTPFLHRLLPLLPQDTHMLITGRSFPPAPLWRMRSKQTLCVLDEAVIRFTEREAKKLFESYGLAVNGTRVAVDQTRGRASALDMMARQMSRQTQMETRNAGRDGPTRTWARQASR